MVRKDSFAIHDHPRVRMDEAKRKWNLRTGKPLCE